MKKIFLIICLSLSLFSQNFNEIQWLFEEIAPYSYMDENNNPKGVLIDILRVVCSNINHTKMVTNIKFYPWARAYKMLENRHDVVLPMSINEERVKVFNFVGGFKGNTVGYIGKIKYNFKINKVTDLKNLSLGVVRNDIGHVLIKNYYTNKKLTMVNSYDQLVKMLEIDRLDVIIAGDIIISWAMKKAKIDKTKYEMILPIKKARGGFAFNKKVNPTTLAVFRNAYKQLDKEGVIDKIILSYK